MCGLDCVVPYYSARLAIPLIANLQVVSELPGF